LGNRRYSRLGNLRYAHNGPGAAAPDGAWPVWKGFWRQPPCRAYGAGAGRNATEAKETGREKQQQAATKNILEAVNGEAESLNSWLHGFLMQNQRFARGWGPKKSVKKS